MLKSLFGSRSKSQNLPQEHAGAHSHSQSQGSVRDNGNRQQTFIKPFRWRPPEGQTKEPEAVEVVGSFTDWQRVPMAYDKVMSTWHVTLHNVVGNRTHHYVLLVDGTPTFDETCDGLAVPNGQHEKRYQLDTEKGPRVMMLFGQTK